MLLSLAEPRNSAPRKGTVGEVPVVGLDVLVRAFSENIGLPASGLTQVNGNKIII